MSATYRVERGVGRWLSAEELATDVEQSRQKLRPGDRRGKTVAAPRLPQSDISGVHAVAPFCPRCENVLVWRGAWQCDGCCSRITAAELARSEGRTSTRRHLAREATKLVPGFVLDAVPVYVLAGSVPAARGKAAEPRGIFSSEEGSYCASTRNDGETQTPKQAWNEWLDGVEVFTSGWRAARAARLRLRGARVMLAGGGAPDISSSEMGLENVWSDGAADGVTGGESKWHKQREKGQAERFARIRECGAPWATFSGVAASGKEVNTTLEKRCDCWRICARCLERRKWLLGQGIEQARAAAISALRWQMARKYTGSEGRWTEKMFTLTVAHGSSPAADAELMVRAWRRFTAKLAEHLKIDRGCELKPVWVRALEVAPGPTGGHAHLHVWWLGPFVDHAHIRDLWGRCLREHGARVPKMPWADAMRKAVDKRAAQWCRTRRGERGKETEHVWWPIVWFSAATAQKDVGKYAQKVGVTLARYTQKVGVSGIERMHPAHVASIYAALESARCVQWARGWAPKKNKEWQTWKIEIWSEERRSAEYEKKAVGGRGQSRLEG